MRVTPIQTPAVPVACLAVCLAAAGPARPAPSEPATTEPASRVLPDAAIEPDAGLPPAGPISVTPDLGIPGTLPLPAIQSGSHAGPVARRHGEVDTTLQFDAGLEPRLTEADEPGPQTTPLSTPISAPISFELAPSRLLGRVGLPTEDPRFLDFAIDPIAEQRSLSFSFDRETNLVDGGLGGAGSADRPYAYSGSDGARFNRYSVSVEWNPAGEASPLQWLVVGGVHAIKADLNRLDGGLGLSDASGTVTIPTVGTGFRWAPAERFSISTIARTQSVDQNASMLDLVVSADLEISRGVGFTAGYEFYESDLTVQNVSTSIDREGYFARITIRF